MNQHIFFTDLDDTLLNSSKELSPGNREALETLLKRSDVIALSTGRALQSARAQAQKLGLAGKNCYLICFNGAQIFDTESETLLFQRSVPMRYVRELFDAAHAFGVPIQTYSSTHVLAEKDSRSLRKYCEIQDLPCQIFEDVTRHLTQEPAKLLAIDYENPQRVVEFRKQIAQPYEGKLDLFQSHPALLEIVPPGVNKGAAVRILCERLNIPLENTVAAGDAENDLSMIEAAHVGAAMKNAVPLLKEHADYITQNDHNHDGAAEIVQRFLL